MRFLHCADLHIGSGGSTVLGATCLDRLADAAVKAAVDALIIAGDLFDRSARCPQAAQAVIPALTRLAVLRIPVYCIDGNHDFSAQGYDGCLDYLRQCGLLQLLRPVWDLGGQPHAKQYDGMQGCVAYVNAVRIVGLGFLFEKTREHLKTLSNELTPYDGFTVAMLHTGVYDGRLPKGGIMQEDLLAYRGLVQYFALGHRHAREEHLNAYNPGSPCAVHMFIPQEEHGYYIVETEGKTCSTVFIPTMS